MYDVELFAPGALPAQLARIALLFIRRRFKEVWSIDRYDVTMRRIKSRHNVVLRRGEIVVGWLGVEQDGELSNACIEPGLGGVALLERMCKHALSNVERPSFYAEIPVENLTSATVFVSCGFRLSDPPRLDLIIYPDRAIMLARLEYSPSFRSQGPVDQTLATEQLNAIGRLRDHAADYCKYP